MLPEAADRIHTPSETDSNMRYALSGFDYYAEKCAESLGDDVICYLDDGIWN